MTTLALADIQGFILNGYHMDAAHYMVLEVNELASAKQFLGQLVCGDESVSPQISSASVWSQKPSYCLNIGITSDGMRALGFDEAGLATFPNDFRQGAAQRAESIGDTGHHAPDLWKGELGTGRDHVVLVIHAKNDGSLDEVTSRLRALATTNNGFNELHCFEGRALPGPKGLVHFGFVDDIGQPRFKGDPLPDPPDGGQDELDSWHFILQYTSGNPYSVPQPDALGLNGSYMVFRIMEQDCAAFENVLEANTDKMDKELLAAKMCGRWRDGAPLALSPDAPANMSEETRNAFLYKADDRKGLKCPIGAHTRRTNPRDQPVSGLTRNHRMMRRGMPYGPEFDPANPDDGIERGLIGVFICSSIENQFEFILTDWINASGFTGGLKRDEVDPLIGNQTSGRFSFQMPDRSQVVIEDIPQLVYTRGSAYCFLPSLNGLSYIANS